MTRLTAAGDAEPAEWIVSGLHGFAKSVLSLVPGGFAAYVRVFHPARLRSGDVVTWAEIATANDKEAHAGMQLNALTGMDIYESQPGVFDICPAIGRLDPDRARALAGALERHTTTAHAASSPSGRVSPGSATTCGTRQRPLCRIACTT